MRRKTLTQSVGPIRAKFGIKEWTNGVHTMLSFTVTGKYSGPCGAKTTNLTKCAIVEEVLYPPS